MIIIKITSINKKISIFLNPCFCVAVKVSKGLSEMLHGIYHFHIDHNAPRLSSKLLLNHCLRFLLGRP